MEAEAGVCGLGCWWHHAINLPCLFFTSWLLGLGWAILKLGSVSDPMALTLTGPLSCSSCSASCGSGERACVHVAPPSVARRRALLSLIIDHLGRSRMHSRPMGEQGGLVPTGQHFATLQFNGLALSAECDNHPARCPIHQWPPALALTAGRHRRALATTNPDAGTAAVTVHYHYGRRCRTERVTSKRVVSVPVHKLRQYRKLLVHTSTYFFPRSVGDSAGHWRPGRPVAAPR
jgi:hypothetical protein